MFNINITYLPGADLASPSDELKMKAILSISNQSSGGSCGFYTGIHSLFSKGDYTSIEGNNCTFSGKREDRGTTSKLTHVV